MSDCGCYDGPYMEGSSIMVSVRCSKHMDVSAKVGHGLMRRKRDGTVVAVAPRDTHTARDLALAKQRRTVAERGRRGPRKPRV